MSETLVATGALRHRLPQEFIDRHKRERILAAICELAHERGAGDLTTARIAKRARIARPTLYEFFGDKAGCLEFARRLDRVDQVPRSEACWRPPPSGRC